jgi:Rod binding domain-containing protein
MKTGETSSLVPRSTPARHALDDKAKARLEKATRDFEAIFIGYMLKSMRGAKSEENAFGDSFGGDLMSGMFDQEFARYVAHGNAFGIGEMMYKSLTGEKYPEHVAGEKATSTTSGGPVPASSNMHTSMPDPVKVTGEKPAAPAPDRTVQPTDVKKAATPAEALPVSPGVPDSLQGRLEEYEEIIQHAAALHGVDSSLVKAVIATESGGRADAISGKKAKGLMQLVDSTAADMGVKKIWDPGQNILGGVKYLKEQLNRFNGNVEMAAAAYNAGPGAVQKHGGVPPYRETQQYVRRVLDYFSYFQGLEASNK